MEGAWAVQPRLPPRALPSRRSDLSAFFRAPGLDGAFPSERLLEALQDTLRGLELEGGAAGNVVLDAKRASATKLARSIEATIQTRFGFSARVVVITAADLTATIQKVSDRLDPSGPAPQTVLNNR